MGARVDAITRHFLALLDRYSPDEVSAEAFVWYGRGAGAGTHVMRVCGALRAVCVMRGVPFTEYQARDAKLAVTGSAKGEKAAMQAAVGAALRRPPPATSHEADALGVALCHVARLKKTIVIATKGGDVFGNVSRITKKGATRPGKAKGHGEA
jgi:Holliday junction resolvasome RuvABC endonuclease subunit